jgi:hypothetical protein
MTDLDLIEFAAKAAGINLSTVWPRGWDPLTDDGDALRLAVKLRLHISYEDDGLISCGCDGPIVSVLHSWADDGLSCDCETQALGDHPGAATRRAIVRAAAEIGRRSKAR